MSINEYRQLSFFTEPQTNADPREPITITWNMHHGCNRANSVMFSAGMRSMVSILQKYIKLRPSIFQPVGIVLVNTKGYTRSRPAPPSMPAFLPTSFIPQRTNGEMNCGL